MNTVAQIALFHNAALWMLALLFLIILLASEEIGYHVGRRRRTLRGDTDAEVGGGSVVVSSMLALLALILAFTYSAALNRHEARKASVILEANALGTAFLRSDLFAEPGRSALRQALYEYTSTRVPDTRSTAAASPRAWRARQLTATLEAQATLWPRTRELVGTGEPSPADIALVSAINDVLDIGSERLVVLSDKLPAIVVVMLIVIAGASLAVTGFIAGIDGQNSRWRLIIFAAVLAFVMVITLDYDRPADGFIQVNRMPLEALLKDMQKELGISTPIPGPGG